MSNTIHISGKTIIVVIIAVLLLFGALAGFFFNQSGGNKVISGNSAYENLPEKCRLPAGQDIESWKEHLGHHAETRECLNYFD